MTRLLLTALLVPASFALAAPQQTGAPTEDPMAGWVPPKVTDAAKSKKEIQALYQTMDAASKRGDIEAAADLMDFPVLMATDDSRGEGIAEAWDRERWIEMMRPFYGKPAPEMKVTHKPDIFLLSDSLASVDDVATVTMGPRTTTMRNTTLLVRRDGKWLVKAMAEGGWGDMMNARMDQAGAGAPGAASEGTGSGGTGSGAQGGSEAPGSGVREPPAEEKGK